MAKDEEKAFVLTKGSRYRVQSVETKDKPLLTNGVFRGYTAIGPDEGICMEMDESHKEGKGRIRVIPCHMILSIDVLEAKAEEEKKGKEPEPMFG